jgi:O-antigen ligase
MPWLLAGYMWLYLHRPFEYWTFLGTLQIERMYMLGIMVAWLVSPGKLWPSNRLHGAFLYFTAVLFICWAASPYPQDLGQKILEDYIKVGVFFVLLVTTIRDERGLRQMLTFYFAALFLYQCHSLLEFINGRYEYRMGTVRMKAVDLTYGDPNTFAATLLHALPFLIPFWVTPREKPGRWTVAGYTGLSLLCMLLTGSRRAFIGLIFLGGIVALRSRHRWKLLLLGLLLAPAAFTVLPDNLKNRFLTIIDPSYGPSNATTSRDSRLLFFQIGMQLWSDNPLTGVGPAAFALAAKTGLQAHNLYAQTVAEMGTLGLSALLLMVFCFWKNAREARRLLREHPWWEDGFASGVVQNAWLAVVLLLFMGLGGHNLYRYNWLWFGAFQLTALGILRRRAAEEAAWIAMPAEAEAGEEEPVGYHYAL